MGAGWPKISGRKGRPNNHSSSRKTRLNDLSHGIKIWTDLSSVLSQFTRLLDRQTDRQTDSFLTTSPRWRSMQRGKKYTRSSSADETANVHFFTTTSYTYYKIRKLRYNLTESLQKFYHGKI